MRTWSKVWEYPWLWFNGLSQLDWRGRRIVDLGSEISPMPWLLAKLGAEVLLVEADGQWIERWERVRRALGVPVRWSIVGDERIKAPDGWADAVISFSVIERVIRKTSAAVSPPRTADQRAWLTSKPCTSTNGTMRIAGIGG